MSDAGWGIVFILGLTVAIAAVAIVAIWQGLIFQRTKVTSQAEAARDDAYRTLAREATATQQAILEEQRKIARDVADLRERMASVEKMMREVG